MDNDKFIPWIIHEVKRFWTFKLVIFVLIVALILSVIAGRLSLESFLSDEPSFANKANFIYINFILHLVLVLVAVTLKNPMSITFNEVEINLYNEQRRLSFLRSNNGGFEMKLHFQSSNQSVNDYLKLWKKIWWSWLGLYFILIIPEVSSTLLSPTFFQYVKITEGFFQNFFNNLSSLFFLFCFVVLANEGYVFEGKTKYPSFSKLVLSFFALCIVEISVRYILTSDPIPEYWNPASLYSSGPLRDINLLFSILSGLIAVIAMSLVIGRLDSKLIGSPLIILIALYCYAGLQVFLRDYTDPGGYLMLWVMFSALFFKAIFLLYTLWLAKTKRLFFYFLGIKQIYSHVNSEWGYIRNSLISETNKLNFNLTGEWEIIEEYENGRTKGDMALSQDEIGNIEGVIILNDWMHTEDGRVNIFTVRETISGIVAGKKVELNGSNCKILEGNIESYSPDKWKGEIVNEENIIGVSEDDKGIKGQFIIKRKYDLSRLNKE